MAPFWEILKDLNCCYTSWEAFGNIWATFYSNIWSHKLKNEKEEEEEDKKVKKKRNFSFFKWLSVCLQQVQEFLDTFHITLPPCLSLSLAPTFNNPNTVVLSLAHKSLHTSYSHSLSISQPKTLSIQVLSLTYSLSLFVIEDTLWDSLWNQLILRR